MGRLTLRLPDSLHQRLTALAEREGVSLNQYIVYALTRQTTSTYTVQRVPETEVEEQRLAYKTLLANLGKASTSEVEAALATREVVEPETVLEKVLVERLRNQIYKEGANVNPRMTDTAYNSLEDSFEFAHVIRERQDVGEEIDSDDGLVLLWQTDLNLNKDVAEEYTALLAQVGINNVAHLAQSEASELLQRLQEANEKKELGYTLPSETQLAEFITKAKDMINKS